jgi:hypothetical protein
MEKTKIKIVFVKNVRETVKNVISHAKNVVKNVINA